MKKFTFYICSFMLISFTVALKLGSWDNEHYDTCLTENNASHDDMFTTEDVLHNRYKSKSQEEIEKNGCVLQCLLEKSGVMHESEYNKEKMLERFIKVKHSQPGETKYEAFENCINETKDLTQQCEKSFALAECYLKAEDKMGLNPTTENPEETT